MRAVRRRRSSAATGLTDLAVRTAARPSVRGVAAGALHGATEWLPVSSSGHVALLIDAAGWPEGDPARRRERRALEVALHTGSLIPVGSRVVADLRASNRPAALVGAGVAATGLTALVGGTAGPLVERRFAGPRSVAAGLVAGSVALVVAERRADRAAGPPRHGPVVKPEPSRRAEKVSAERSSAIGWSASISGARAPVSRPLEALTPFDVFAVGLGQGLAIWPGVSRRAATVAAARARGLDQDAAGALSWIVGLPTLVAATTWQFWRSRDDLRRSPATPAAGAAASIAVGLATRGLPDRTSRWPATAWALWRLALAAATLRRRPER